MYHVNMRENKINNKSGKTKQINKKNLSACGQKAKEEEIKNDVFF